MPTLERPAHACAVPVSDEHLWELTAAFLADGLAAGEQVVYGENGTLDAVLGRLVDDGVAVRGHLGSGRLVVVPADAVRAAATASAAELLTALDDVVTVGLRRFPGVRVAGETSAAMHHDGGAALVEYESRVDEVLRGRPARLACFYDRNRFTDGDIARLRAVHRVELTPPAPLHDDDLVRITVPGPFVARLAGEVDHSNRPRIRAALEAALETALEAAPEAVDPPPQVRLDLASLRFLDVAGAAAVVHFARGLPAPQELVLTGVRPGIARLLDRCGAPFADRLRVVPHPGPWRAGDADPAAPDPAAPDPAAPDPAAPPAASPLPAPRLPAPRLPAQPLPASGAGP